MKTLRGKGEKSRTVGEEEEVVVVVEVVVVLLLRKSVPIQWLQEKWTTGCNGGTRTID